MQKTYFEHILDCAAQKFINDDESMNKYAFKVLLNMIFDKVTFGDSHPHGCERSEKLVSMVDKQFKLNSNLFKI